MDLIHTKKNIIMKKNFCNFKIIVYKKIQLKYLVSHISLLLKKSDTSSISKNEKILIAKEIFEYLSRTKDIWTFLNKFSLSVKDKAFELAFEDQTFQKYLINFGYICPYKKRDGHICGKKINDKLLCQMHIKCKDRLKARILENLKFLPSELCNIIFKYIFPKEELN